jgi:hypothetical protein
MPRKYEQRAYISWDQQSTAAVNEGNYFRLSAGMHDVARPTIGPHSKHRHGLPICVVTTMHDSETEVYGENIKYGANKAEPLIGRLTIGRQVNGKLVKTPGRNPCEMEDERVALNISA